MKTRLLFVILIFPALSFLLASCSEDDITDTVKWCNHLDARQSQLKRKTLDITGITNNVGAITAWFDGGVLAKANVSAFTEISSKTDDYYFRSGSLVCVHKVEYMYNKPKNFTEDVARLTGDSVWFDESKTVVRHNFYYFYNGRMVKWINDRKSNIPETSIEYQSAARMLLSEGGKLEKLFRE